MRSQGHVRFIKVSSRVQMTAAAVVCAVLLVWVVTMATVAISQFLSQRDRMLLLEREAKVESSESRLAAYRDNLDETTEQIAQPPGLPRQGDQRRDRRSAQGRTRRAPATSKSLDEAAKTVEKVSAAIPEAAGAGEPRSAPACLCRQDDPLRQRPLRQGAPRPCAQLGLDPEAMLRASSFAPGRPARTAFDRPQRLDRPALREDGPQRLARMETLEDMLDSVPQVLPRRATGRSPRASAIAAIPSPATARCMPGSTSRPATARRSTPRPRAGFPSSGGSPVTATWSKSATATG